MKDTILSRMCLGITPQCELRNCEFADFAVPFSSNRALSHPQVRSNGGLMNAWHWLIIGLVGFTLIPALWRLHRLGLWLEDRGWLYYQKKRPSSGPMSSWVGLQQFVEPGVRHVVEIRQERRIQHDEANSRERLLANLLACLDAVPVRLEEIRTYLTVAKATGMDWEKLYEEAVQIQRAVRPGRTDLIPQAGDVTPPT
jgi:hypothetical protein